MEINFDPPRSTNNISFPVYQRNDDVSQAFTPAIIDGPLNITMYYDDNTSSSTVLQYRNVSWAPKKITLTPKSGGKVRKISMATNATTGCYGYIVQPRSDYSMSLNCLDVYGNRTETPSAQVYMYKI